jgi:hypothetical protein
MLQVDRSKHPDTGRSCDNTAKTLSVEGRDEFQVEGETLGHVVTVVFEQYGGNDSFRVKNGDFTGFC